MKRSKALSLVFLFALAVAALGFAAMEIVSSMSDEPYHAGDALSEGLVTADTLSSEADVHAVGVGQAIPSAGYEVTVNSFYIGKSPRDVPPVREDDFPARSPASLDKDGVFVDDHLYVEVNVTIKNVSVTPDDAQPLLANCILMQGFKHDDALAEASQLMSTDLLDLRATVHSTELGLKIGEEATGTLGYVLTEEELNAGDIFFVPDFTGGAFMSQDDVPDEYRIEAYWVAVPSDWS